MHEKWRVIKTKKPYISWLGSGIRNHVKGKVVRTNAIRLEERNSRQQQQVQHGNDNGQLGIVLPHLQLNMALVLVLVQENNQALDLAAGSSQGMLAAPIPNGELFDNLTTFS